MSPQAKKAPASQASAKLASTTANKAAKTTLSAVESSRSSAENVVKIGTNAVKELFANSTGEAQKAQEKVFALSRESAANIAKSADAMTKAMYEGIAISRDNMEAAMACGNITAAYAREISDQLTEYTNDAFATQMELSKNAFNCRTLNDMLELQNRFMRSTLDSFFNESLKLSEKMFEYTTEALEPVNERIAESTEQFQKVLSNASK